MPSGKGFSPLRWSPGNSRVTSHSPAALEQPHPLPKTLISPFLGGEREEYSLSAHLGSSQRELGEFQPHNSLPWIWNIQDPKINPPPPSMAIPPCWASAPLSRSCQILPKFPGRSFSGTSVCTLGPHILPVLCDPTWKLNNTLPMAFTSFIFPFPSFSSSSGQISALWMSPKVPSSLKPFIWSSCSIPNPAQTLLAGKIFLKKRGGASLGVGISFSCGSSTVQGGLARAQHSPGDQQRS